MPHTKGVRPSTSRVKAPPETATFPLDSIVFATPLVVGESAESYASLGARAVVAVKPRNFIEEIFLRDVVDLTWEIIRLRKFKARLLSHFLTADGNSSIFGYLSDADSKALKELCEAAQTDE